MGIAIIVVYFFVYKAWILLLNTDTKSLTDYAANKIEEYKNPEIIKVETKEVQDFVEFDNLKIQNIFKNYEELQKTEDGLKYIVYKDDSIDKYVSISKSVPYSTIFIEGFKNYSEIDDDGEYEDIILYEAEETYEYLLENGVTSESKLFDFLTKNYDNESKVYSSNAKMKENHYIKSYIANVLPTINQLYVFDGINGYMFGLNSGAYEVHVNKYTLTIVGLSKEEISNLVGTIIINEKKQK